MYNLDKAPHVLKILRRDPWELWRVVRIGAMTTKYHYIRCCVGRGTVVGIGTEIINAINVKIGEHCLLQDAVYIRAGTDGQVAIGDRVAINSFCRFFGHGGIDIGEDTQIGPGTLITTTGHNYQRELEALFTRVVIGKAVWIGANVTILPGVEIGDGAVIGAGSVVPRAIPPRFVAVGVPARVIKSRDEVCH